MYYVSLYTTINSYYNYLMQLNKSTYTYIYKHLIYNSIHICRYIVNTNIFI